MQAAHASPDVVAGSLFEALQSLRGAKSGSEFGSGLVSRLGTEWALVAGLAGAGDRSVARAIESALVARFQAETDTATHAPNNVRIVGDLVVAAAAGLPEPGVLLWAGTGSFAVARDLDGGLHRVGGRGAWLGDCGSGVAVVRHAARMAIAGWDGLGPSSPELVSVLCKAVGVEDPGRLGVAMQNLSTGEVASHFPKVAGLAADGDALAQAAIQEAAGALVDLARAAGRRAGLIEPIAVRYGGGLLAHADSGLAAPCCEQIRSAGFQLQTHSSDAAVGAAKLALAALRETAPSQDESVAREDSICRGWLETMPASGPVDTGTGGGR